MDPHLLCSFPVTMVTLDRHLLRSFPVTVVRVDPSLLRCFPGTTQPCSPVLPAWPSSCPSAGPSLACLLFVWTLSWISSGGTATTARWTEAPSELRAQAQRSVAASWPCLHQGQWLYLRGVCRRDPVLFLQIRAWLQGWRPSCV